MTDEYEILGLVRRINRTVRHRLSAQVAGLGLGLIDVLLLAQLYDHGPQRLTQLGRALRLSPSTVFGVVERLAQRGLPRREADPKDRRAAVIVLRDEQELLARGTELLRAAFPGLARLEPDSRRELAACLGRLLAALEVEPS